MIVIDSIVFSLIKLVLKKTNPNENAKKIQLISNQTNNYGNRKKFQKSNLKGKKFVCFSSKRIIKLTIDIR